MVTQWASLSYSINHPQNRSEQVLTIPEDLVVRYTLKAQLDSCDLGDMPDPRHDMP